FERTVGLLHSFDSIRLLNALVRIFAMSIFFFQAEDGIRDRNVTGVQTCALPISAASSFRRRTLRSAGLRVRRGPNDRAIPSVPLWHPRPNRLEALRRSEGTPSESRTDGPVPYPRRSHQ